jgi:hypothetical protein
MCNKERYDGFVLSGFREIGGRQLQRPVSGVPGVDGILEHILYLVVDYAILFGYSHY